MELGPGVVVERREELVLELLEDAADPRQLALAVCRDAHDVTAAVERIALPFDKAALLQ